MAVVTEQFTIDAGPAYPGVFKMKVRLTHRDVLVQDQFRRELLGPSKGETSPGATAVADVFSKLWVHILESPLWWKEAGNGIELVDEAPVAAVYKEVLRIEQEAVDKVKAAGTAAVPVLKAEAAKGP